MNLYNIIYCRTRILAMPTRKLPENLDYLGDNWKQHSTGGHDDRSVRIRILSATLHLFETQQYGIYWYALIYRLDWQKEYRQNALQNEFLEKQYDYLINILSVFIIISDMSYSDGIFKSSVIAQHVRGNGRDSWYELPSIDGLQITTKYSQFSPKYSIYM